MSLQPKPRMNADQFLVWAEGMPGRHELVDGEVFSMSPQRVRHAETKFAVQTALKNALRDAGSTCRMLPDGITVRIDESTVFEPDALVQCGERPDPDSLEARGPVIIVEVLSPGTQRTDTVRKLDGYFRLPTTMHYLIVDPKRLVVVHHARAAAEVIETRIVSAGSIRLDPPGIVVSVADFFPES